MRKYPLSHAVHIELFEESKVHPMQFKVTITQGTHTTDIKFGV
jgi:hypothetical protein